MSSRLEGMLLWENNKQKSVRMRIYFFYATKQVRFYSLRHNMYIFLRLSKKKQKKKKQVSLRL